MDENKAKNPPLFPKPMQIAKVIAPLKKKRDIIRAIEELGEVEPILVDPRTGIDQISIEDRRNETEALRTKINTYLNNLDQELISKGSKISVDQSEESVLKFIREVANEKSKRIAEIIQRKEEITSRRSELVSIQSLLDRFKHLSIDHSMIGETRHTRTILGTAYPPQIERILWTLNEITDSVYLFLESEIVYLQESVILVTILQKDADVVFEKLKGMSVQEISIPNDVDFDGLTNADCTQEDSKLEIELEQLDAELDELAKSMGHELKAVQELCKIELQRISVELKMRRTETTCVLWAWIPEELKEEFTTKLQQATDGSADFNFKKGDFDPENAPSYLQNSKFMKPMRGIVTSYGVPSINEIDPYPFVKILMPLMFAIMFADVGHGLLFLLFGIWAKRKKDAMDEEPEGLSAYIFGGSELIIIMGATAMLIGFPMNSLFGDETILWQVPILKTLFEHNTWSFFFNVDSQGYIERDYLNFLIFSFSIGAIVILVGLALNIYKLTKYRQYQADLNAALSLFGGYFFIVVGVIFALEGFPTTYLIVGIILGFISLISTMVIEFRAHSIDGLMLSVDHILSLMSNTFSFGRLLAMNTVHFVLAFLPYLFISIFWQEEVLNHSVEHWVPSEYLWIWILAAIIGSAIVLPVEGVFSTLQALRLNWVEFFGKFFTGAGVEFKPIIVKRIYTLETQT